MNKRIKRTIPESGMSFLDVICCGFGAIIILLLITKVVEFRIPDKEVAELEQIVVTRLNKLNLLKNKVAKAEQEISSFKVKTVAKQNILVQKNTELNIVQSKFDSHNQNDHKISSLIAKVVSDVEKLTQEVKKFYSNDRTSADSFITGIPIDSEYIIFIIDTSGSMFNSSWDKMLDQVQGILNIYPRVKGIQVMNDQGRYMFSDYQKKWIPDTLTRRTIIRETLRTWSPHSNSSPVEGIQTAINDFRDPNKKISLYVLGDDFTGSSIENIVTSIRLANPSDDNGKGKIRIHAIGFPVQFGHRSTISPTGVRFANLMRELTYENDGTFVGLPDIY